MQKVNIILVGFGRVGRAFYELLKEKYDYCRERYGLFLELKGIIRKSGSVLLSGTGKLVAAAESSGGGPSEPSNWVQVFSLEDLLEEFKSGVVVDCTPSDLKTGEPGYSLMRTALEKGWHVVTASKGALVVHPAELAALARENQVAIKASGATAAALPTLDVGLHSLAGTEILAMEGILNGTTNYILTRMAEGLSFSRALLEASEKGIAEPNPVQDIEGWDTAAKMVIIANRVLGTEIKLSEIRVNGLRGINEELVARAASLGKTIKLIGRCSRDNPEVPWKVEVGLALLDPDHPLASVNGSNKGIIFYTDCMGYIVLTGGKSDPRGAGAALLKDIISIYWCDF
ncbi:MAG: homoserine dehydrogenase [Candidatus Saccharicenans sp.]|jgi:homoserine dehydrogenase|nr:homoserine dehydrogenase [Candidatus Saccharicenans sp.]MDH7492546.1 homoserine dehydrogenase [Candidatus Saccharicenans sp.]